MIRKIEAVGDTHSNQFIKEWDIQEHNRTEGGIFCVLGVFLVIVKFEVGRNSKIRDTITQPGGSENENMTTQTHSLTHYM
jgi:hypothetical protein